jgi:hypothetical protein
VNAALIIGSYSFMAIASVYLLVKNRFQYMIYSVVLVLNFGAVIGSLFAILHLPGANELMLTGFAGSLLGAALLIWNSFRNIQDQVLLYKLLTGLILIFQIVSVFIWPAYSDRVALLNYPLTAFVATVLINEQYEHRGEKNMLVMFMLLGLLYIVIDIVKLF